jgi:hypothetical protein
MVKVRGPWPAERLGTAAGGEYGTVCRAPVSPSRGESDGTFPRQCAPQQRGISDCAVSRVLARKDFCALGREHPAMRPRSAKLWLAATQVRFEFGEEFFLGHKAHNPLYRLSVVE